MSASIRSQIEGLRVMARAVAPRHLVKSGAVARESEAKHLLEMVKDAMETLERNEGYLE